MSNKCMLFLGLAAFAFSLNAMEKDLLPVSIVSDFKKDSSVVQLESKVVYQELLGAIDRGTKKANPTKVEMLAPAINQAIRTLATESCVGIADANIQKLSALGALYGLFSYCCHPGLHLEAETDKLLGEQLEADCTREAYILRGVWHSMADVVERTGIERFRAARIAPHLETRIREFADDFEALRKRKSFDITPEYWQDLKKRNFPFWWESFGQGDSLLRLTLKNANDAPKAQMLVNELTPAQLALMSRKGATALAYALFFKDYDAASKIVDKLDPQDVNAKVENHHSCKTPLMQIARSLEKSSVWEGDYSEWDIKVANKILAKLPKEQRVQDIKDFVKEVFAHDRVALMHGILPSLSSDELVQLKSVIVDGLAKEPAYPYKDCEQGAPLVNLFYWAQEKGNYSVAASILSKCDAQDVRDAMKTDSGLWALRDALNWSMVDTTCKNTAQKLLESCDRLEIACQEPKKVEILRRAITLLSDADLLGLISEKFDLQPALLDELLPWETVIYNLKAGQAISVQEVESRLKNLDFSYPGGRWYEYLLSMAVHFGKPGEHEIACFLLSDRFLEKIQDDGVRYISRKVLQDLRDFTKDKPGFEKIHGEIVDCFFD